MGINPIVTPNVFSGVAPLAVWFDAKDSTTTEDSLPFHHMLYLWNFNDPDGGAVWTYGSRSGLSKNTMRGPLAAHVFKNPGTYNVSCLMFDGVSITEKITTITVTNPDTVYSQLHFFSNDTIYAAGTPAHDGVKYFRHDNTTGANSFNNSIQNFKGTNRALYFERDDIFTASDLYRLDSDGPWTVGANPYASGGARPLINGAQTLLISADGNTTCSDGRVVDLNFDGQNNSVAAVRASPFGGAADEILLHGCRWTRFTLGIYNEIAGLDTANTPTHIIDLWSEWFVVDCLLEDNSDYGYLGGGYKHAWLGTKFGVVTSNHNFRSAHLEGAIIHACEFGGAPQATITIRGLRSIDHNPTIPSPAVGRWVVVSNSKFIASAASTAPFSVRSVNSGEDTQIRDVIFDGNWFITGAGAFSGLSLESFYTTVRNNLFDLSSGNQQAVNLSKNSGFPGGVLWEQFDLWNNTAFSSQTTGDAFYMNIFQSPISCDIQNNLGYFLTSGTKQFLSGGVGSGTVDNNSNTEPASNGLGDSPNFASGLPVNPVDFQITVGSYAIGAGNDAVKVFDDFFGNIRRDVVALGSPVDTDIGFHAFTQGELPAVVVQFLSSVIARNSKKGWFYG